jgi:hypothetical protein
MGVWTLSVASGENNPGLAKKLSLEGVDGVVGWNQGPPVVQAGFSVGFIVFALLINFRSSTNDASRETTGALRRSRADATTE